LGFVLVLALACVGMAGAAGVPSPHVACGSCGGGSTGWTGCSQVSNSHSANVGVVTINHYLVVNFCKVNGIITSIGVAAHGCDASGFASCSATAAWGTGGGVGSGWATFTGHAQWVVYAFPISNTDVVDVTVGPG
jgi:hypothetical protein